MTLSSGSDESTSNSDDRQLNVLLIQYAQCWEDYRSYDHLIWQTPTISLALVGIAMSALINVSGFSRSFLITFVIMFFALSVSVVGTIQLRKHKFAQIAIMDDLDHIEEQIIHIVPQTNRIGRRTPEIMANTARYPRVPRAWLDSLSAYSSLFWLMSGVSIGLAIAFVLLIGWYTSHFSQPNATIPIS